MQRHLMLACALALGLTACDGPNAAATTPPPAGHSAAETGEEHLAAVTAEAERIEREFSAREEAENIRKLREMGPLPDPAQEVAYIPDPVNGWYAMNPEHIFCDSLTAQTGDAHPDQFIGKLLSNGGSVMRLDLGDGAIQVIDRNDPRPFTTIVFVRGLANCRIYLRRAQEQAAR